MKKKQKEKLKSNLEKYRDELKRLEDKYNGFLSPKEIVKEAVNYNSPLHDWFTWDRDDASKKWLEHEARQLLKYITVKINFQGGQKEYREYINVRVPQKDGKNKRFYVNTKTVIQNEDFRSQFLRKAMLEAEYWQKTYSDYKELETIFISIDKTKKKLKKVLNYA